MKRVYSGQTITEVAAVQGFLDSHGIASQVRHEYLGAALGEVQSVLGWAELWIEQDDQFEEAQRLLRAADQIDSSRLQPWKCPECGEVIEGQFSNCWNCGAEDSSQVTP